MPTKKVIKDYGLRQHEVTSYQMPPTEAEMKAMRAAFKDMKSPDQAREWNAEHVRTVLREAGADAYDTDLKAKFGEQAAYVTMAEWLRSYDLLQKCRARIEAGKVDPQQIALLILHAEDLGKLQERIWWRHGVDPVTGSKRENLAVSARESRRALPKGRAARDAHNAAAKAEAEQWKRAARRMAGDIWAKNGSLSAQAVAEIIHRKWPRDAGEPKAVPTIRAILKKPDRA